MILTTVCHEYLTTVAIARNAIIRKIFFIFRITIAVEFIDRLFIRNARECQKLETTQTPSMISTYTDLVRVCTSTFGPFTTNTLENLNYEAKK